MDLIALAVPFFLLALIIELVMDRIRGSGRYRSNDAINSLSAGILNSTTGYFTKFIQVVIWSAVLTNFALMEMPLEWFDASPRGIALWVLAAVLWDFCYYWNHRFGHEISVLWAAHAVHHQSEDYNLSTALRQTSSSFLISWIFYVPLFLIGFPFEIVVTVGAANLIYQFWVHTQFIRRMGVLDRILVTPSNHRVHHAQNERYIDKNYGGIFILWDRMFGTFQEELDEDPVVFGVRKPLANLNPFWANLQVYDYLLFDAIRTRRWQDKLGIWFRRTGWRPADVAEKYPKAPANLSSFEKYDPSIAPARKRYVLVQFVLVIAQVFWVASLYATGGANRVVVPCLLMWTQLFTIGLLSEGRSYSVRFEAVRLLFVIPVGIYALQLAGLADATSPTIIALGAIYISGSLLWLRKS